MRTFKTLLFAGVFALVALFTINANAGKNAKNLNCWTDVDMVGQHGTEDQSTENCPGQRTICCYTKNDLDPNNPIEFYLLPKQ